LARKAERWAEEEEDITNVDLSSNASVVPAGDSPLAGSASQTCVLIPDFRTPRRRGFVGIQEGTKQ
jgi:hypothetical protein